jgi:hypothetical protein
MILVVEVEIFALMMLTVIILYVVTTCYAPRHGDDTERLHIEVDGESDQPEERQPIVYNHKFLRPNEPGLREYGPEQINGHQPIRDNDRVRDDMDDGVTYVPFSFRTQKEYGRARRPQRKLHGANFVIVQQLTNAYHPAFNNGKGYGAFARMDLAPGQFIMEYAGKIINLLVAHLHSRFAFNGYLYDFRGRCIDASDFGNESRFINDFRGIAYKSNVTARPCINPDTGRMGMCLFATSRIKSGQELLLNYGAKYWIAHAKYLAGLP